MDKPRRARTVQRYQEYQGKLVRTGKLSKSWEVSQNELWGTESWPREKQMQRNQGGGGWRKAIGSGEGPRLVPLGGCYPDTRDECAITKPRDGATASISWPSQFCLIPASCKISTDQPQGPWHNYGGSGTVGAGRNPQRATEGRPMSAQGFSFLPTCHRTWSRALILL